jgi:hypothetical protein
MLGMDEKRCETCDEPLGTIHPGRPNRFCSQSCYFASATRRKKRVAKVKGQRMKRAVGHPIAPPSGVVAVSRLTLYDHIGGGPHPCHWCGAVVQWKTGLVPGALIVDHLNWDQNDDRVENLLVSCNRCNSHRVADKSKRLIEEGEPTVIRNGRPTRAVQRSCESCGNEFLTIPAEVAKGKGRFCSRSCARRAPRKPKVS